MAFWIVLTTAGPDEDTLGGRFAFVFDLAGDLGFEWVGTARVWSSRSAMMKAHAGQAWEQGRLRGGSGSGESDVIAWQGRCLEQA